MYCRGSIPPFFAGWKLQYLYIGNSGLSAGNSTNLQGDRLPVFASFDRYVIAVNACDISSNLGPAHVVDHCHALQNGACIEHTLSCSVQSFSGVDVL